MIESPTKNGSKIEKSEKKQKIDENGSRNEGSCVPSNKETKESSAKKDGTEDEEE